MNNNIKNSNIGAAAIDNSIETLESDTTSHTDFSNAVNPLYSVTNNLDIFNFHDTELELLRFIKNSNELTVSVKHLIIHKNTDQNTSNCDMVITDAVATFTNIHNLSIIAGGLYIEDEKGELVPIEKPITMTDTDALDYLITALSESDYFYVYELSKTVDGRYCMPVSCMPKSFNLYFSFDNINISWNEYENIAWYEQKRLKDTEELK